MKIEVEYTYRNEIMTSFYSTIPSVDILMDSLINLINVGRGDVVISLDYEDNSGLRYTIRKGN